MLSKSILKFLKDLQIDQKLPKGVVVLDPYIDDYTLSICKKFYEKYYHDDSQRTLMLGINPGRFGSGLTGISFTDPVKLETICGIPNTFPKKVELSADFIHKMIFAYGGLETFYKKFFISSVCPLGFTKDDININYYDDKKLEKAITPFVMSSVESLLKMGMNPKKCFVIGEGKNFDYFSKLNGEHQWFDEVVSLPHPRFIMQYKRKLVDQYVDLYLERLSRF